MTDRSFREANSTHTVQQIFGSDIPPVSAEDCYGSSYIAMHCIVDQWENSPQPSATAASSQYA